MYKLIILLIILFLTACEKTDKNTETAQDTKETIAEPQSLTEAECWKLFDTFWIEFQKAVVDENYFRDDEIKSIKKTNKKNNYHFHNDKEQFEFLCKVVYLENGDDIIKEKDVFKLKITRYYIMQMINYKDIIVYFGIREGRYKTIKCMP